MEGKHVRVNCEGLDVDSEDDDSEFEVDGNDLEVTDNDVELEDNELSEVEVDDKEVQFDDRFMPTNMDQMHHLEETYTSEELDPDFDSEVDEAHKKKPITFREDMCADFKFTTGMEFSSKTV